LAHLELSSTAAIFQTTERLQAGRLTAIGAGARAAPPDLGEIVMKRERRVEIDKTDPLDKLQHKMNLVSNYFTK
jgi:hypothetical protein